MITHFDGSPLWKFASWFCPKNEFGRGNACTTPAVTSKCPPSPAALPPDEEHPAIRADAASTAAGGASAPCRTGNIGAKRGCLEPSHGSAPDIAGKGIANPLAQVLSFAMLLRYSFDMEEDAKLIEAAVTRVLAAGLRTADLAGPGGRGAARRGCNRAPPR